MFSAFHEYTLNVRLVFGFLAFRCSLSEGAECPLTAVLLYKSFQSRVRMLYYVWY